MMKVYNSIPNITAGAVTIGSFDGVHLGHKHLINELKDLASKRNLEEFVLTFEPHPRLVIQHNSDFRLLTTIEEKIKKFEQLEVQNLIIIPFSENLSQLSAEDFILDYILTPLNPKLIVLGYDHKFGKDRKGSQETFETIQNKGGFDFEIYKIEEFKNINFQISSTNTRNYIKEGKICDANEILGEPYSIQGSIIEGKKIGRTIGFPTANIEPLHLMKLIPKKGVYATIITMGSEKYFSATNIGINPTISENHHLSIETYIFDFDQEIYGREITLQFHSFIRDEIKYLNLEELKSAIANDVMLIRRYFEKQNS